MKLHPLSDRILVKPLTEATTTPGGLHIPDTAREKATGILAKVIAVGPGYRSPETAWLVPVVVAPGDTVYFVKYSGVDVTINGERLYIIRETEVLGVLSET